jgi:plasmid stabilization system protein ParE
MMAIFDYRLEVAGPAAALRLERRISDAFDVLAENPRIGTSRPHLTSRKSYLFWIVENYWVVYRCRRDGGIIIVTVIDARRDVRRVLR